MKVFAVLNGEAGQGMNLVALYTTRQVAIDNALKSDCCFDGGWNLIIGQINDPEEGNVSWENGCDILSVEGIEVNEE